MRIFTVNIFSERVRKTRKNQPESIVIVVRNFGEFDADVLIDAADELGVDGHEDRFQPLVESHAFLVDETLVDGVDRGVAEVVAAEPSMDEEVRVMADDSVLGPSLVEPAELDD